MEAVPENEPLEGCIEVELWGPVEVSVGVGGVQFEVVGFVWGGGFVEDPGGSFTPEGGHAVGDPGYGLSVYFFGAEVVCVGVGGGVDSIGV